MEFLIYMLIGIPIYLLPFLLFEWFSKDAIFGIFSADEDDVGELLAVVFAVLFSWLIWPISIVFFLGILGIKKLIVTKQRRNDEK